VVEAPDRPDPAPAEVLSVRIEDDLDRHLLTLLDGTRDRTALLADLRVFLAARGDPMEEALLRDGLERSLQGLARLALSAGLAPLP
jgi:hypothetical protein